MNSKQDAVRVSNLSKMYKAYRKPIDILREKIKRENLYKEVWALKNISFEIQKGEVVGVIGLNGSGKSTLLKILAGTLDKTSGDVEVNGIPAAILELGTGFHPQYSGRENVYLGGMCLGMKREEIDNKIDEIIDFSELDEFIDMPFKTYSSGMQARLTFATAMSVSPDVFLIDEALAVGDAFFQNKSFKKIKEFADSGTTIFFVTHSLGLIDTLCTSGMLLHNGELIYQGDTRHLRYKYENIVAEKMKRGHVELTVGNQPVQKVTEDLPARIIDARFHDAEGNDLNQLKYGEEYFISLQVISNDDLSPLSLGFRLETPMGKVVYGISNQNLNIPITVNKGKITKATFSFPCYLNNGKYILGGGLATFAEDVRNPWDYQMIHQLREGAEVEVFGAPYFQGDINLKSELINVIESDINNERT